MKTIPLSKGLVALVDDEDFERLNQYKWSATFSQPTHTPYGRRDTQVNGKRKRVSLHRFLMNAQTGFHVDHIDGNGLNNQKSNLRICEPRQNQMNMKCRNKHGLKGVTFDRRIKSSKNPWVAQIKINYTHHSLGNFPSKIDAAIAYNIAASEHFGLFARLNPVPFVNVRT